MAGLFTLSAIPGEIPGEEPQGLARSLAWVPPSLQNLLHLLAYGLLAVLWFRGLTPYLPKGWTIGIGLALTIAYGLADEWHQAYVPGRFPSATDVVADALGALAAAAL
ncbi:VanZ family protein [Thiohalorhabdus sp.]|uniref:VanZ family protein n=1 Tax=Thiohalorhabdus sp. TaxID=3094134 RepID=UPI002FC2E90E